MLADGREKARVVVCRELEGLLRWGKEKVGGERCCCARAPGGEIQSASGTGRRTEAAREADDGEVMAALAGWPVEEVRGGMALGDWRKALLLLFEEAWWGEEEVRRGGVGQVEVGEVMVEAAEVSGARLAAGLW